jgi:hypothetical protein
MQFDDLINFNTYHQRVQLPHTSTHNSPYHMRNLYVILLTCYLIIASPTPSQNTDITSMAFEKLDPTILDIISEYLLDGNEIERPVKSQRNPEIVIVNGGPCSRLLISELPSENQGSELLSWKPLIANNVLHSFHSKQICYKFSKIKMISMLIAVRYLITQVMYVRHIEEALKIDYNVFRANAIQMGSVGKGTLYTPQTPHRVLGPPPYIPYV